MHKSFRVLTAALILVATLLPGAAAAQTADPVALSADTAITLSRELTGRLAANTSGSFAFYKVFYPGDGKTVTVNAHFLPDDPLVLQNAGMKIYDIRGRLVVDGGRQPKLYPNMSGDILNSNVQEAGIYVIQLYNYDANVAFDYKIWAVNLPPQPDAAPPPVGQPAAPAPAPVAGLPPPVAGLPAPVAPGPAIGIPAPVPALPPAPAPAPAAQPGDNSSPDRALQVQPEQVVNGGLEGSTGGKFAYYKFTYKGDQSTATINLQIDPDDPEILKNAGFKLYGPQPGKEYASGGAQKGMVPNVSANLIGIDAGEYVVQVYNYNPQTTVGFALAVTGIGPQPASAPVAPPPPAAAAPQAAPAAQPAADAQGGALQQQSSFKGRLKAGASGAFALYEFNYPGNREVYTINLQVTPDTAPVLKNAGFKVYGPQKDKVYVEGGAQVGLIPNMTGNLISIDPGTYVVQVYNYNPEVAIDYELGLVAGPRPGEDLPKTNP